MREFRIGRAFTCYGMLVSVVILAGGCTTSATQNTGVGIGNIHLADLKRHEYQILDTVEGEGKVTKILGFGPPFFSKQWGWTRQESESSWKSTGNPFSNLRGGATASSSAMYNALTKIPNADAFYTMSKTLEYRGFKPFYWTYTARVKGKAIRIKPDSELERRDLSGQTITITTEGDMELEIEK